MDYSSWGHKRVRHDVETKQQCPRWHQFLNQLVTLSAAIELSAWPAIKENTHSCTPTPLPITIQQPFIMCASVSESSFYIEISGNSRLV